MVYEGPQEWYHGLVNKVNEQSSSGLLCQVVVLNAMKPRRLSPRVILQISLWSVIIIVVAFIVLYSFLLTYMNRHVYSYAVQNGQNTLKEKYSHNSHKVKFRSKGSEKKLSNMTKKNSTFYFKGGNNSHRKVLWNSGDYDVLNGRPQCLSNTSILTILITSSPDHFEERIQIRKTWCSAAASALPPAVWQCVFLIGQADSSKVNADLDQEARNFQDILRGSYVDSYRNLTVKVLHGLHWNSRTCSTAYTLKTDDDCFVNSLQLYMFLRHCNPVQSRLYVGIVYHALQKRKVIRDPNNKWSVSVDSYARAYYPPYASGVGYVLSQDVVQSFVKESRYIHPIPNEDAYIGIVSESVGVEPISSSRFTLFSVGLRLCNYLYVLVSHGVKPTDQLQHHTNMMQAQQDCQADSKITSSWS